MRLKPEQIEKISDLILQGLKKADLVTIKVDEKKVKDKIYHTILKNIEEEAALDAEVDNLLNEHSAEIDAESMDYRKMFGMIKNKLVRERDIII